MKVLLLVDCLGPGGAQRQLVGLAVLLKKNGYDVSVAFYHDIPFYLNVLADNSIECNYLKKAQNKVSRLFRIPGFIRKSKPDIVIAYLETPTICACLAKLVYRKMNLIVSERNTSQKVRFKEYIRFNLFRLADSVVPNAFSQKQYIANHFAFLDRKTHVIPNFVDTAFFVPRYHKKHLIPEILIVATIWPSKNTLGFIDAVREMKNKGLQFSVKWYGKNQATISYFNLCIEKIRAEGLEDFIELKEKTNDIREKYQESDVLCLPSFYEGTPNVICEAMACGLPILCSNVCDNPIYVEEGRNGFLFDPNSVDSICKAFDRYFELSDSEYENFCRNSRERAESISSMDNFLDSYVKLFNQTNA
ncbi:MAG: glycosyltransferase family 4 protein [Bacteroidales bacterium]|nr:glycosyltransferase family 4 protein [Bacteroidales bacterium]